MSTPTETSSVLNIADLFLSARVREGRGDRVALHTAHGDYTYDQVDGIAARFARGLAGAGVFPEQRVVISLPDCCEFPIALFGILRIGAVPVMLNPGLSDTDLIPLLDYIRPRMIVTTPENTDRFEQLVRGFVLPCGVSMLQKGPDGPTNGNHPMDSPEEGPERLPSFPTHPDDPALWLFSGGTTGTPKAVVQTHRSFANTTKLYAHGVIGYREDDVTISVPKLYFGYATGSNLFFPLSVGGTSVLFPEPPTPELLFELIAKHRATILVNVPTMIHKMLESPTAKHADLSSLRVCTSAGEALPAELHARWMKTFGVELLDGLGTAEMWHIFVSNAPGRVKPGTLGQVVPGFDVKVCDEEGRELPRGETGYLWVRGDSRALGYWRNVAKTAQAFRGEWYVSGDMITMDDEGYVSYHGRGDELLKVAGKWLAPQEVEGCLLSHPAVAEACVVGIADANGLVKPRAYVVAREAREGLDEELKAFVRERLDAYKHPRDVRFVASLPRTHLGKVDRGKLRRDWDPPA
jgi:benzoate-CoA ligase family protein